MNEKQISLLAAFAAANVEYAVVGGVAVNAYGYVRATHDLDVFIRPTEENARAAFAALRALGVPLEGLEPGDVGEEVAADVGECRDCDLRLYALSPSRN